jgi:hypothetical protein
VPEEFLKTDDPEQDANLNPGFIKNDASANEIKQGGVGDCWFISALSVIAGDDKLIVGGANMIDMSNLNILDKNSAQECS